MIWRLLDVAFYLEEGVCLDEALHLDDSGACLLDVAGVHLERSRNWRPHLDDSGGVF